MGRIKGRRIRLLKSPGSQNEGVELSVFNSKERNTVPMATNRLAELLLPHHLASSVGPSEANSYRSPPALLTPSVVRGGERHHSRTHSRGGTHRSVPAVT